MVNKMKLKEILKKHHKTLLEIMDMEADKQACYESIRKLDDMNAKYESIWGVDRLPLLVSKETRSKWESQMEKLNAALIAFNPDEVFTIVNGCLRGLVVMDNEARAGGNVPNEIVEAWYIQLDNGKRLAVTRCNEDAKILQGRLTVADKTEIVTLTELVNIYDKAGAEAISSRAQKTMMVRAFDFSKGDELDF